MKKAKIICCIAGTSLVLTGIVVLYQHHYETKLMEAEYKYQSRHEALRKGILKESPGDTDEHSALSNVVLSVEHEGNLYAVVKAPYHEDGRTKHVAYVAVVKERNGRYGFFKCTADFGLNANGEIEDDDFAYYSVCKIENVDGLGFAIGKIYDKYYVPYNEGQPVSVMGDGIFAAYNVGAPPEIDMTHNGELVETE